MTEDRPALITVEATCNLLSCSRSTVYSLIRAGKLRPVKLTPGCTRFARADVEALVRGEG